MPKILLDFVFPIEVVEPIPAASTAFLKQAIVVAKPKAGQEANVGQLFSCTTMAQVLARTDNTNAAELFAAGMTKVLVLLSADLNLAEYLEEHGPEAYTVLISSDFDEDDATTSNAQLIIQSAVKAIAKVAGYEGNEIEIQLTAGATAGAEVVTVVGKKITVQIATTVSTATQVAAAVNGSAPAMALLQSFTVESGQGSTALSAGSTASLAGGDGLSVGGYDGVIGMSADDAEWLKTFATPNKRVGFFRDDANLSKSMFYAFGKFLAFIGPWSNLQYIEMPYDDGVNNLGDAIAMFDDRVSFVINDDEYGKRLSFFVAGGKAIIAPYVKKELQVALQSRSLQWIAANQPQYTLKNAALLETRLNQDVIEDNFIARGLITEGKVTITLVEENFVANGDIVVPDATALWRSVNRMRTE